MSVLDTNVHSALMRREADQTVVSWLDLQPSESVWTTSVTVFEIRFGLELLAPSRRKRQLGDAFSRPVDEDFHGRILPFDHEAAREAASLAAQRRAVGRSVDFRDIENAVTSPRDEPHSLPVTLAIFRILELRWSTRGHCGKANLNCASPVHRKRQRLSAGFGAG